MKLDACLAGVGMTRFGKHMDTGLKALGCEAVRAALVDARLGPGDLAHAHSPREFVPLAEVEQAALIYALTAQSFCLPEK